MSKIGEYLELSEDQTSERHQELLAEFERRKKVSTQQKVVTFYLKSCARSQAETYIFP